MTLKPASAAVDRYLSLCVWARRRYAIDGLLMVTCNGKPTKYTLIERASARKYLNITIN